MLYLYRRGDGNEGNSPQYIVELQPDACAFAALEALLLNEYSLGTFRTYLAENLITEGESEYGVSTMLLEGPDGETAFEAAYITAELEPIAEAEREYMESRYGTPRALLYDLDSNAAAFYELARK